MNEKPIHVSLHGVPETLLWPLYCRAEESKRADALLSDAKAVALQELIDYPYASKFGDPHPVFALRAACFDEQVRTFLADHPKGTVVALGDGLETGFWRVDNEQVRWLSVDLPEVVELRNRFLPDTDRYRSFAASALSSSWMDEVDPKDGLLITAQGLLMYFEESDVQALIARCAERFPTASIIFDAMPAWLTSKGPSGTWLSTLMMRGRDDDNDKNGREKYTLPPMRWGAGIDGIRKLLGSHPNIAAVHSIDLPPGRGLVFGYLAPNFGRLPLVRNARPCNALVTFRESAQR